MDVGFSPIEGSEQEEVARLRRLLRYQLAAFISFLAHVVLVTLLVILPFEHRRVGQRPEPESTERKTPVPIAFVVPRPPERAPVARSIPPRTPPPPKALDETRLRMEPAPPSPPRTAEGRSTRDAGSSGGSLAGSRAGSPPSPSDGRLPAGVAVPSAVEPPLDLKGRLRNFRESVERYGLHVPDEPEKPEGQGSGQGGLERPDLPGTGFGVGNLEFTSRDYDWNDYGRAIYWAIWKAWHYRLYLTTNVFEKWAGERRSWQLDHSTRITFTILRSGKVVGVTVESPSGCEPLDTSALEALLEVILPPLPADFRRDQETVHARFIATGDIRGMRVTLQALKDAGWFGPKGEPPDSR